MSDDSGVVSQGAARRWLHRLRGLGEGLARSVQASPLWSGDALVEVTRSVRRAVVPAGGPADDLAAARDAALDWLARAQDATAGGGVARGYSLVPHRYLGGRGWQASYPETTGYIIPTLYLASRHLRRPGLGRRARDAAEWEVGVQLPSGAVVAGVQGQPDAPAVFNTGQVLLGWLCAFRETDDGAFADAARRAADYLADQVRADGSWARRDAPMARLDATLYNARTSWALAEAGALFGRDDLTNAAARNLRSVAAAQHDNGWLPRCCLTDPDRPLLHTLAYAYRGLLEGGRVLDDASLVEAAERGATALAGRVSDDGRLAGRFRSDWSDAVSWSCLTGQAQMCNVWLRLAVITGDHGWRNPVPGVLAFLASTQNRSSGNPGVRGGIAGSSPVWGDYGRFEILNWATKFFVDALIRHERAMSTDPPALPDHLAALP